MKSQPNFEDQTPIKVKIAKFLEGLMGREPSESEVEECRQSLYHLGKALTKLTSLKEKEANHS